jgi:hypothetical protein
MKNRTRGFGILGFLIASFVAQSAFATAAHWQNTYYVSLNFSPYFGGAKVSTVTAHLKIMTANGHVAGELAGISLDGKSETDQSSFFKQVQVSGSSTNDPMTHVVVTYAVKLSDGTEIPEGQPSEVPLMIQNETLPSSPAASDAATFSKVLGGLNGSTATLGVGVSQGWAD